MLEFKFNDGELVYLPENCVEYICIEPKTAYFKKRDKDGNILKDEYGDIRYDRNIKVQGASVVYKLSFFDKVGQRYFYREYPDEKIEDDEEFSGYVNFLKSAFIKKNVKNI